MSDMIMKSAVDTWIAVLLWGSALVCLWAAKFLILGGGGVEWITALAVATLGAGLPFWMLLHTVYRLDDHELVAQSGPFRWRVSYRDIRTVQRRREFASGPALAMDRLVIEYGAGNILVISPTDPAAFQTALNERVRNGHSSD